MSHPRRTAGEASCSAIRTNGNWKMRSGGLKKSRRGSSRAPDQLRRTLSSTNVIESAFSIVETVCRNVKRWRAGDQIERWVGSGLLVAERQFRKVIGFRQIPLLLSSLANAVAKKPIAKGAAVA